MTAMEHAGGVERLRTRSLRAWLLDAAVVAVVVVFAIPYLVRGPIHPRWLGAVGAACIIAPLLLRRIRPVPVFAVIVVAAVGFGLWDASLAGNFAPTVALYTVASLQPRRQALWCAAVLEAILTAAVIRLDGTGLLLPFVLFTGLVVAALALGLYSATRRAYVRELVDRADRLERERDQANELATASERARIAREMHDIIAHHLTVMVALTDGAGRLMDNDPAGAGEAVRAAAATGREALRDTRRLLGVLADDHNQQAERRPLPTLADLDALVEQVRAAGLPVDFRVRGPRVALPSDTGLAIYRLVQEALTNTLKHAPPRTRATVAVTVDDGAVRLAICDDGAGTTTRPRGTGRGISGMTARVHAVGGQLSAGPGASAGWQVSACIPLADADPARVVASEPAP